MLKLWVFYYKHLMNTGISPLLVLALAAAFSVRPSGGAELRLEQWERVGGPGYLKGVEWAFGQYWMVGSRGVFASRDGRSWEKRRAAAHAVAFGGGRLAIASDSGMAVSTDGEHWQEAPYTAGRIRQLAFGNGLFLGSRDKHLAASTNGLDWTYRGTNSVPVYDIEYAAGKFAAVGRRGISTSNDGRDWEVWRGDSFFYSVCYGNGTFVAVGDRVAARFTDPDDVIVVTNTLGLELFAVYFDGKRFVGIGAGGVVHSPDGLDWTEFKGLVRGYYGFGGFAGNMSVLQPETTIYTSVDGAPMALAWPDQGRIHSLIYANGMFVGAGITGESGVFTMHSPDGLQWSFASSVSAHPHVAILYAEGRFLGTGLAGQVAESQDGRTWTEREHVLDTGMRALVRSEFGYFAGGSLGRGGVIYRSIDGKDWVKALEIEGMPICALASGKGMVAAIASPTFGLGWILVTTNGTDWEAVASSDPLAAATFANGRFVAAGENGTVGTSTDGRTWRFQKVGTQRYAAVTWGGGVFLLTGDSLEVQTSPDCVTWTRHVASSSGSVGAAAFGARSFVLGGSTGELLRSGAIRPELAMRPGQAEVVLTAFDPAGEPLRIERSADLVNWQTVDGAELREPTVNGNAFFRARVDP